ncbi:protein kinase [Teratosphaeria destructans]|uniref:non-specific serine/threonine protein kinase n=1 Tax=Teratosphaeria destructans TaxID=418781 RepID=A0A9W7W1X0_9PEZI|nr:protein kinase [Teratosphaeria destructans]
MAMCTSGVCTYSSTIRLAVRWEVVSETVDVGRFPKIFTYAHNLGRSCYSTLRNNVLPSAETSTPSIHLHSERRMPRWLKWPLSIISRVKNAPKQLLKGTRNVGSNVETTIASTDRASCYYTARTQERFKDGRYEAIRRLGTGQYSHVWLATDLHHNSRVALKLLTSDCYGTSHDIFEIGILESITKQQASGAESSHVISLLDTFRLEGPSGEHKCIVMPVMGASLGQQANRFADRRIPVKIMKEITKQILRGLAFLHETCKTYNPQISASRYGKAISSASPTPSSICRYILTTNAGMACGESGERVTPTVSQAEPGRVKIIDLGVGEALQPASNPWPCSDNCTASWVDRHLSDRIQPEQLRAPEVIIGAPWGPPVDIWSLGCLTIEFIKGHVAFFGEASPKGTWSSEDDHLAQYMEVLGPMPPQLLERGSKTRSYFDEKGNLLRIPNLKPHPLAQYVDGTGFPFERPKDMAQEEVPVFVAFLRAALALDQQHRATAADLLRHKWLSM